MKLELKHIAPYLPYKLRVKSIGIFEGDPTFEMGLDTYSPKDMASIQWVMKDSFKPILRPLSDLTKEIEHNGEKFVPIQEMFQVAYESIFDHRFEGEYGEMFDEHEFGLKASEEVMDKTWNYGFTVELPYSFQMSADGNFLTVPNFLIYQKFFEWHFDVFELMGGDLAVDINKLI